MKRHYKIDIYKNRKGEWAVRLIAPNGRKLLASGDGYKRRIDAVRTIAYPLSKAFEARPYLNGKPTTWNMLNLEKGRRTN